ncbi:hypothetical protein DSCA_49980 [Desulfosarcina alkanivorans]|uniref:HEPN domain-containing protein n=1 Tax=Desulfosarcina alkanivorans TaxID=571177 RepID=A0A5K7YQS4_9BACT|nr:hypothetical protein [Desulfosarcina alkanivorans]BBO71068.1 hypothetical protein DSCA_49980 [Desulfosarcina alkanivorans]
MQIQPIPGWRVHIMDGRKYLKTATRGQSRPAVFNNELIFQLAAMAIEKMMVGVSQYHHQMPFDHTLSGLTKALSPVCPMDPELADRIRAIERMDDMCSLTPVQRSGPSDTAIRSILDIGRQVAGFAERHLPLDDLETLPS